MNDRYIVQAWSNVDRWQDTRHHAATREGAEQLAEALRGNDASWMPGAYERKTRVRDRLEPEVKRARRAFNR